MINVLFDRVKDVKRDMTLGQGMLQEYTAGDSPSFVLCTQTEVFDLEPYLIHQRFILGWAQNGPAMFGI